MVKGLEEAVEAIETAFEEEKKEKEKEMLLGLEERAAASGKWTISGKDIKKEGQPISIGTENVRNESTQEVGYKGLRLKDCLEYYRNNIARETVGTQPVSLLYDTQKSHPADISSISRRNEKSSNYAIPISGTTQLSENRDSVPLRSHFAHVSNQSILNTSLSTIATEIPQQYMLANSIALPPHSLQVSRPSGAHPQVTIVSSALQQTVTSPYHFSVNQRTSPSQNHNIIANTQQIDTILPAPISLTQDISQTVSATTTTGSIIGQLMTTPQNITTSPRLSVPIFSNYRNISCASIPALSEQLALTPRSGPGLNTITAIDVQKSVDGTVLHPQVYDSPFAPNKMHSNFARSIIPTSTISTLVKPAVIPAHHLIYSQDATTFQTTMSPWHQPLRNGVNNLSGPVVVGSTRMACTIEPTTGFQSFVPNNQAAPARTTPVMDIMNAPLDVVLPVPLTPTHLANEIKSSNSSVEVITVHSSSAESTRMEEMNLGQMPQLLESAGTSSGNSTAVQTPRPAAAVAPIMQTDFNTTSAYDSTLCITNVTSMSYSPMLQPKTAPICTWQHTEKENISRNEEGYNSNVKEIMDPQTFTIGNTDPVRLEKRNMREQFKTQGIGAHLPPLDPTDPINCIDAHYWLNKP
ncbi:unnamed protein product [Onchocerca flexuosa]|uniref:JmjC domain-containing protein n=1 Tax=Onchocerca flexuosa TaxID=387005 RepID=A0A183H995_9BILA|nr:unnamed protein product [Onchocerca flexuosa]